MHFSGLSLTLYLEAVKCPPQVLHVIRGSKIFHEHVVNVYLHSVSHLLHSRQCDVPSHHERHSNRPLRGPLGQAKVALDVSPMSILNGVEDVVDGNLERSEVNINSVDFEGICE